MNHFMMYGSGLELHRGFMFGHGFGGSWSFLILVIAWSLVWKGLALWKAARSGSRNWFTVLLILQTAGILEILYLFVFSKPKAHPVNK